MKTKLVPLALLIPVVVLAQPAAQTPTPHAVASLKKAFKGIICKMNLIPYNPVSEFDHQTPSQAQMTGFRSQLEEAGIHATIRTPRGKDVNAACGQLRHLQS